MQIHEIKSSYKRKKRKTIGRGGKRGTYSGKGQKGQRSRSGHRIRPALRDTLSKLPKLRGIKHPSLQERAVPLSLKFIENKLPVQIISREELYRAKIIRKVDQRVKIVDGGDVKRAFSVYRIPISKSAKEKILKAGGKVL